MYNPQKCLLKVSKIITRANPYISLTGSLVLQYYYGDDLKRDVGDLDFIINKNRIADPDKFRKKFVRELKKFGYGVKLSFADSDGYPFTDSNNSIFWKGIIFCSDTTKIPFDLIFIDNINYYISVSGIRNGIRILKKFPIWEAKFVILKYKRELYDLEIDDDQKIKLYDHIRKISLDIYHMLHA